MYFGFSPIAVSSQYDTKNRWLSKHRPDAKHQDARIAKQRFVLIVEIRADATVQNEK
jgi:hypothetical protein